MRVGSQRNLVRPHCLQSPLSFVGCGLQCLQFQTDQLADVKKVEKLNNLFFTLMAKGDAAEGLYTVHQ